MCDLSIFYFISRFFIFFLLFSLGKIYGASCVCSQASTGNSDRSTSIGSLLENVAREGNRA